MAISLFSSQTSSRLKKKVNQKPLICLNIVGAAV